MVLLIIIQATIKIITMKLYIYIYYHFRNYYSFKWEAFLSFIGLLSINLLSVVFIFASIFDFSPGFYRTGDYLMDRFILVPIVFLLPMCLVIFIYYKLKLKEINGLFETFRKYRQDDMRTKMILYFIFSGLFFFFSIISSRIL